MTKEQKKQLKAFFDLPVKEQSDITGMPVGTLASYKSRFNAKPLSDKVIVKLLKAIGDE